jgi:hypothetical protein
MRNFNQFCRKFVVASVLVLALTCSAFAGDMPLPNVTSPPPSSANGDVQYPGVDSSSATTNGDMQYPGVADDTWTDTALNLLQGVLSLF